MIRKYELKPQKEDYRDYKITFGVLKETPVKVDLRNICPRVFDQGALGSCSANAGVAARMIMSNVKPPLSRLFLYYKERELEGTTGEDSGATMRDVCKALKKYGVCKEIFWRYNIENFAKKPRLIPSILALRFRISSYMSFDGDQNPDNISQVKQYLFLKNQPVLVGVQVYESFESEIVSSTGFIPIPNEKKEQLLGGHAMLIVGYDDKIQSFIVMNSWGNSWGDNGYGYLPYDFARLNYAFDFWVIE
ncbi:MAG: C1 family peptidase [Oscillospiraceae bacterium]